MNISYRVYISRKKGQALSGSMVNVTYPTTINWVSGAPEDPNQGPDRLVDHPGLRGSGTPSGNEGIR